MFDVVCESRTSMFWPKSFCKSVWYREYIFVISSVICFHAHVSLCFVYLAMNQSDSVSVDKTTKPLSLKNNDLFDSSEKQIPHFDLRYHIKHVIGVDLLCVLLDRNLWRVYLKSTKSHISWLLTQENDINNVSHQFYDTNPYTSGATSVAQ